MSCLPTMSLLSCGVVPDRNHQNGTTPAHLFSDINFRTFATKYWWAAGIFATNTSPIYEKRCSSYLPKRVLHRSLASAGASDCRLRLLGKIVPTDPLRSAQDM